MTNYVYNDVTNETPHSIKKPLFKREGVPATIEKFKRGNLLKRNFPCVATNCVGGWGKKKASWHF